MSGSETLPSFSKKTKDAFDAAFKSRKQMKRYHNKHLLDCCSARTLRNTIFTLALLLWLTLCECRFAGRLREHREPPIYASYTTSNRNVNFTHLITDKITGRVYIGATNWIYQFNDDLKLEHSFQTGPVKDSPNCSPSDCSSVDPNNIKPTNNVNKVLVIDPEARMLIVCGSVHQGSCRRHKLEDIRQAEPLIPLPVSANDENSSTVAFVGPAHYFENTVSAVLYVAVTNSRLGPYRAEVPAISSRSLETGPRLFSVIEKSFTDTARVDISYHLRDYYLVKYIYGFHSEDFVYFATVQRKSHLRALEEWGYVTRLARVCISDAGFHSYAEITLECTARDGTDLNILQDAAVVKAGANLAEHLRVEKGSNVLIGVFAASKDHTMKLSSSSGLCIYPLTHIESKFTENIHLCYNGSVLTRNMDYIAGSVNDCPEPGKTVNVPNFCNEAVKLNGSLPLSADALIIYQNTTLTSITATTTGQHTVAFVGTSEGILKKILIANSKEAEEFEEVTVDSGFPILADINLDHSQKYVFAASPYKVAKIKIERCFEYSNCSQCLGARNPYCGWCSLERRCTAKSECDDSISWELADKVFSSPRWLPMETSQCIDFEEIRPSNVPINSVVQVELIIQQLPPLPYGSTYLCVFGEKSTPVVARQTHNGLSCLTPPVSERPKITSGKDHVTVNLAVKSTVTKTDFIQRSFVFYDCSVHKTCRSCVTSEWACNWCTHENICSENASVCSRRVIHGENNAQQSLVKGREHCPSFRIEKEILIPNGARREIAIEVVNLVSSSTGFECIVEIEEARERVVARFVDNKIICAKNEYTYEADTNELQAQLSILRNGDMFIDKTNVTLYKCHLFGSHGGKPDCSLCQTTAKKYECVWCAGHCSFVDACKETPAPSCPPPRIDWIHPLSGPVEGGTLVTIEGSNLGSSEEEVRDKISIGGVPCVPLEYTVSVRVVCRTGPSTQGANPVVIVVGNRAGVTRAQEKFQYKTVHLNDVSPKFGPQSGGTRIYLTGSNFNIGSNMKVFLDDFPCDVKKTMIANNQISCRTTSSPFAPYVVQRLRVIIDGANLTLHTPFTFIEDPKIVDIFPKKSFISGGRSIMVLGENFISIQEPKMAIFNSVSLINESLCTVLNNTAMICASPSVEDEAINSIRSAVSFDTNELKFRISFEMDNVQSVKDLHSNFPQIDPHLYYVPNPKLFHFKNNGIKLYKGESLVIEGENLRAAASEAEVNVTIGTRPCNLTSLTMTQLVCLPPEVQPPDTDELGRRTDNQFPAVVVTIGKNLRYKVGYLRYEVAVTNEIPPLLIGLISAAGALLMLLSLILLAIFRHKSSQAEREYKRIQLQMDTLENSVRLECKQAFAELQTDLTDINNDIQATGIPMLDHKSYVLKIFFPGLSENPLSGSFKQLNGHSLYGEPAMAQFQELIYSRSFLLTFIQTLENQNSFTIRDRVNVASLLMIILSDKMDYAFAILRDLLLKLINKYANSKHPQLLLRRTEFVVEKMLVNWMALCMYNYVKEDAGRALFLLFSAIKHQIEKGPIDAITHDARYSLSEERLLREQIEYSSLIVNVVQERGSEPLQCRLLDCDTITQAKAKILDVMYKNTPVSERPSPNETELEWRESPNRRLLLSDEDITTKTVNGWRRINILAHYGVKDGAVMNLIISRKDGSHVYETIANSPTSSPNDHSLSHYSNIYYTLTKRSPINRNNRNCDNNVRYWHLVRNMDDTTSRRSRDPQSHKAIPEIFLTRLLSTKGTIQKYVDDFFASILTASDKLPSAVKWLFDLFDQTAAEHGITDLEVVHAWKCNSLPLRFWVNLVKNPDFVFDVEKSPAVDSCLSVVAQAFMDACSTSEHRLGKESPSSKLLFARDMPSYRRMVTKFYYDVSELPRVTDEDMINAMRHMSSCYGSELDTRSAVRQLYVYITRYREELLDALYSDVNCQLQHLHLKLESISYSSGPENVLV
ncbi:plexin-B-like protein [Dinothrombium tinctorium]|uniref:Plexin-B-like protein n=1 Tax=Dinothrombium tinctorium TaxID=1965070 RepID=A0A443RS05_9ACAR|nr:plexin-B-like protein [Dinothrombium tinctorium]